MGIENGLRLIELTPIFLCTRSKRMNGEKPLKIETIKLNILLKSMSIKSFQLRIKGLFRIVKNK